jgi:Ca-activated chloride channel family protein
MKGGKDLGGLELRNPENIIFAVIPVLCLIIIVLGFRKKERILGLLKINARIRFKVLKTVLAFAGVGLMFFSLLGPQVLQGFIEVSREGLDIYIAIDTSKSMLVDDIVPDRLSRAKKIIEGILDNLEGDRVGFIPFSSSAYIQMPLTDDYKLARLFLEVIDTDMIGGGGTDIGAAISLADKSFNETSGSDKVVIVLSDGEEHEYNSIQALKSLKSGLKVYAIGIGTQEGGLVPVYDDAGIQKIDYKKGPDGQYVVSKLNADRLKEVARLSGGTYYQSTIAGEEIGLLINDISNLKRDALKTQKIQRFNQIYQYFLGAGMLLFAVSCMLPERRRHQ